MTAPTRLRRAIVMCAALATAGACSSGGGTTTGNTGGISLALSPTSGSVPQGGSATIGVTATGTGGFTGMASFGVTGLPTGVTYTISTPLNSSGVTTATIQLTVGAAVTAGSYSLSVSASGTSVSTVSATFTLTVTSSAVAGYTLSASPTTVSLAQGGTSTTTVTITRTGGFTGSVTLSASGTSSGLTASFSPASTTGNTSTLTLTATAGATVGTVTVTIQGTATGLANQSTTVQSSVTSSGGSGSITLDYTNCGPAISPIWLAYQDGNGPWTRVTPTGSVFHFTASSPKVGFAGVTVVGANTTVGVRFFTTAELAGTTTFCGTPVVTKTVNVSVIGTTSALLANLSLGGGFGYALTDGSTAITNVQPGTVDFFGYLTAITGGPSATDRAVIIRDLNVAANGSAGTADFTGANAIVPAAATFTVGGAASGDAYTATVGYMTSATCNYGAMYSTPSSPSTTLALFGIPAAPQRANDFHWVQLFARNGTTITRSLGLTFHTFAAKTLTLGALPAAPVVTTLGLGAYKQLSATGTISTDYSTSTQLTYTQHNTGISAVIGATQAWIGGQTATLTFPDLTAVSGWNSSWMPAAGVQADWTWLSNKVNYTSVLCVEGASLLTGQVTGSN